MSLVCGLICSLISKVLNLLINRQKTVPTFEAITYTVAPLLEATLNRGHPL